MDHTRLSMLSDETAVIDPMTALSLSGNQQIGKHAPGRGRGLTKNELALAQPGIPHVSSTPSMAFYSSYNENDNTGSGIRMSLPFSRPTSDVVGYSLALNDRTMDGQILHTVDDSRLHVARSSPAPSVGPHISHSSIALSQTVQENVGGTTYFYTEEELAALCPSTVVPNYVMYPGVLPHVAHFKTKAHMPTFFVENELRMDIMTRHSLTLAQPEASQTANIPVEVDNYRQLVPLESPPASALSKSPLFGFATTVYKAVSVKDGLTYCLKRIHGFRLASVQSLSVVEPWKKLQHPNVVSLREVFTTKAFGDNSIVFVYDFHPGCETLAARHIIRSSLLNPTAVPFTSDGMQPGTFNLNSAGGQWPQKLLPESLLWSYIVQLSSAIRTIHTSNLACRIIDASKIIFTGKTRLRLSCVGIFDVLNFDPAQGHSKSMIAHYQQEDLITFGRLIMMMASNSVMALHRDHFQATLDIISRNFSSDLKNLILYLVQQGAPRPRNINDIMPMIGARFYNQIETTMSYGDLLENELAKEVENGRLLRLVCKLGIINERPEHCMEPSWSESGDRYILKLFRDYLFHQTSENGQPWIDMGHIVQCLNKLDAGLPEKVCLTSRDEQSILIVTYAELKRCFEMVFDDLVHPPSESLQT